MIQKLSREEEIELSRLAQQGDREAAERLIKQFEYLAYNAISSFKARRNEDTRAQARLDLWRAILDFDPSKGGSLSTLVWTYARTGWLSSLTHAYREKRHAPKESLDSPRFGDDSRTLLDMIDQGEVPEILYSFERRPEEQTLIEGDINYLYSLIQRTRMGEKEEEVLALHLQGKNNMQIAEILDINYSNAQSILGWARQKIRKRHVLEQQATDFLEGRIGAPFRRMKGGERLEIQRVIFGELRRKLKVPIERIPSSALRKHSLFPAGTDHYYPKAHAINRLLLPHERKPDFTYLGYNKWTKPGARRKALKALEYIILNHNYLVNKKAIKSISWLPGLMVALFNDRPSEANAVIHEEILGLTPYQQHRYKILSKISDNNPTIFNGEYKNAKEMVFNHLGILSELVRDADLTPRQRGITNLWSSGYNWKEMLESHPEFYESIKTGVALPRSDFKIAVEKIRISAIQKYKELFEKGDLDAVRRDTRDMFKNNLELNIRDRYFRIRLGTVLEEIVKDKGVDFEELPYVITHRTTKVKSYLNYFDGSIPDLVGFTFPERFKDWQFSFAEKWQGEEGRERAFRAIDDILERENNLIICKKLLLKYHLEGMPELALNAKSISETNETYLREYLRTKRDDFSDDEIFERYLSNRKFLALLFDVSRSKIPWSEINMPKNHIATMDRKNIYKSAGLSRDEIEQWETRIRLWKYDKKTLGHELVAEELRDTYDWIHKDFKETKPRLARVVQELYSKPS